jgi:hypothetical protein
LKLLARSFAVTSQRIWEKIERALKVSLAIILPERADRSRTTHFSGGVRSHRRTLCAVPHRLGGTGNSRTAV